ncbi:MAG: glycosyltransferase [Pseudomonadota bacterium]
MPLKVSRRIQIESPQIDSLTRQAITRAEAYAESVTGEVFDVVELPDFEIIGPYVRSALDRHDVSYKGVALSMHGCMSATYGLDWEPLPDPELEALKALELEQYCTADGCYAISQRYIKEWQARSQRDIHYIDPLSVTNFQLSTPAGNYPGAVPNLYCIGRMERRKGNDIFIEMLKWLDRKSFGRAVNVGDDCYLHNGKTSSSILSDIAASRNMGIEFLQSQSLSGLKKIYNGPSMVVLPVRYDSFNLVALEALFSGCPVAVSDGAGVCDYLDERFPEIPYVRLPLGNIVLGAERLSQYLGEYRENRNTLIERLAGLTPGPSMPDLHNFYDFCTRSPQKKEYRRTHDEVYRYKAGRKNVSDWLFRTIKHLFTSRRLNRFKAFVLHTRLFVRTGLVTTVNRADLKLGWSAVQLWRVADTFRKKVRAITTKESEDTEREFLFLNRVYGIHRGQIARCNYWKILAEHERRHGNDLNAAAYEIRLLRLLGVDKFNVLPSAVASLSKAGFEEEAIVANAMFDPRIDNATVCHEYLQGKFHANRLIATGAYEFVDDRRHGTAKVSVIVSVYRAADKLKFFLTALAQQTLLRSGNVEIVIVDSASPSNDYSVVCRFLESRKLNVVYARTHHRETIQAAWNRGIHLAKGEYLVFLGADESLYPDALQTLSELLDRHPDIDWVMANSVVTDVDSHGLYRCDAMVYDRYGATKDHAYLETCYISWVGGMYRKNLHERYGYYDSTFRAAGDTEFKNRVLPHIKVKFTPQVLGVFFNYPDDRTTASPTAEVEDLRAWYLHRSMGGIRYAFQGRHPSEAVNLAMQALGYRKSYFSHLSSDIEYAGNLLRYSKTTTGNEPDKYSVVRDDLRRMLSDMHDLEWIDWRTTGRMDVMQKLGRARLRARFLECKHRRLFDKTITPSYRIMNDNRYEQHSWVWPSPEMQAKKHSNKPDWN